MNLASDAGTPAYRAAGFLHGFSSLDDSRKRMAARAAPLKVSCIRAQALSCWHQAPVCASLGIRQIAAISCDWGFGECHPHPGDGGEWRAWEMLIERLVAGRKQCGAAVWWDIWNEPDYLFYWRRPPEQFLETWKRAHRLLRRLDPDMPIIGPEWSGEMDVRSERFERFLRFGLEHDVLPDYFDWHFPDDIVEETAFCRKLFSKLGVRFRGLVVSEYCDQHRYHGGRMAFEIAQIERAGLDQACLASWSVPLGGAFADPATGTPRGVWWVYRRYAQITGRLVATEPSRETELVAGTDAGNRTARILLGRRGGGAAAPVSLRVEGLDAAPYLVRRGRVRVRVERIPDTGPGVPLPRPPIVADSAPAVVDGAVNVTLPWTRDRDAYSILLGNIREEN